MPDSWPELHFANWKDTRDTLHMWTQVVGKVRLALTPLVNHWWNVPLYVTVRGLGTSPMPFDGGQVEIEFDFLRQRLVINTTSGKTRELELKPMSVASFYDKVLSALREVGVAVKIWPVPVEVVDPIPFPEDKRSAYDAEYAQRFWRVLLACSSVMQQFRSGFVGKCSPVHFFWGSFDLAVTRFSGRRAPERAGVDPITREAYSHEASSAGWWPGGVGPTGVRVEDAAFYAYMSPEPEGYKQAAVRPAQAYYDQRLGEYLLMYDDVRRSADPERTLLDFLQTTYEAGATLGKWDRAELERDYATAAAGGHHGSELLAS